MDLRRTLTGLALLMAVAACGSATTVPEKVAATRVSGEAGGLALAGYVTDAAHLLTPEQTVSLTRYLADFERRTRHQMVVVTVSSLEGRDVKDYTISLANRWGIGRKGHDDGVVLLVAPNERKVRITVGYGMEQVLTDDYCAKVIALMTPSFREGRYYEGIMLGATGLVRVARRV